MVVVAPLVVEVVAKVAVVIAVACRAAVARAVMGTMADVTEVVAEPYSKRCRRRSCTAPPLARTTLARPERLLRRTPFLDSQHTSHCTPACDAECPGRTLTERTRRSNLPRIRSSAVAATAAKPVVVALLAVATVAAATEAVVVARAVAEMAPVEAATETAAAVAEEAVTAVERVVVAMARESVVVVMVEAAEAEAAAEVMVAPVVMVA